MGTGENMKNMGNMGTDGTFPVFRPDLEKVSKNFSLPNPARSRYLCMRSGKNRGTSRLSPDSIFLPHFSVKSAPIQPTREQSFAPSFLLAATIFAPGPVHA